jgi:hypothetical protein
MTDKKQQNRTSLVLRIARILGILFAAFISLFALDVFTEGTPFLEILAALFIHLIPTFILLIVLWIAWKRPVIGGPIFILAGLSYIFIARGQMFLTYLLITGIPVLIGSLFLAGSFVEKRQAV